MVGTIETVAHPLAAVAAMVGAALVALAGLGVVRLEDLFARMHAATKASTLGLVLIGLAGALAIPAGAARIALAVAAVFVTAPAGAHLMARAAYRAEGVTVRLDGPDDLADLVDDPVWLEESD